MLSFSFLILMLMPSEAASSWTCLALSSTPPYMMETRVVRVVRGMGREMACLPPSMREARRGEWRVRRRECRVTLPPQGDTRVQSWG